MWFHSFTPIQSHISLLLSSHHQLFFADIWSCELTVVGSASEENKNQPSHVSAKLRVESPGSVRMYQPLRTGRPLPARPPPRFTVNSTGSRKGQGLDKCQVAVYFNGCCQICFLHLASLCSQKIVCCYLHLVMSLWCDKMPFYLYSDVKQCSWDDQCTLNGELYLVKSCWSTVFRASVGFHCDTQSVFRMFACVVCGVWSCSFLLSLCWVQGLIENLQLNSLITQVINLCQVTVVFFQLSHLLWRYL